MTVLPSGAGRSVILKYNTTTKQTKTVSVHTSFRRPTAAPSLTWEKHAQPHDQVDQIAVASHVPDGRHLYVSHRRLLHPISSRRPSQTARQSGMWCRITRTSPRSGCRSLLRLAGRSTRSTVTTCGELDKTAVFARNVPLSRRPTDNALRTDRYRHHHHRTRLSVF